MLKKFKFNKLSIPKLPKKRLPSPPKLGRPKKPSRPKPSRPSRPNRPSRPSRPSRPKPTQSSITPSKPSRPKPSRPGKKWKKMGASGVVAGTAAAYVGYKFASNTVEQRACIETCLPENYHVEEPIEYHLTTTEKEPKCTDEEDESCDVFCKRECEGLHPSNLIGSVTESLDDLGNVVGVGDVGSNLMHVGNNLMFYLKVIIGCVVVAFVLRIVYVLNALRQGSPQITFVPPKLKERLPQLYDVRKKPS